MDQNLMENSRLTIGLLRKEMENARITISLLRELASVLRRDLEEVQLRRTGDELPEEDYLKEIRRLREALASQEKQMKALEANSAPDEEDSGKSLAVSSRTAAHLQHYYRDFLTIDSKHLDREDAERLYEVLKFLFSDLKKAGIVSKKK